MEHGPSLLFKSNNMPFNITIIFAEVGDLISSSLFMFSSSSTLLRRVGLLASCQMMRHSSTVNNTLIQ